MIQSQTSLQDTVPLGDKHNTCSSMYIKLTMDSSRIQSWKKITTPFQHEKGLTNVLLIGVLNAECLRKELCIERVYLFPDKIVKRNTLTTETTFRKKGNQQEIITNFRQFHSIMFLCYFMFCLKVSE